MSLRSYVTLGRSGLRVSPFCLGTMTFGEDWGWGSTPDESQAILQEYLEMGGNFIDTANMYTNGHSEKIVGDFFAKQKGLRDRVVIGTKFFCNLYPGDPNGGGAGYKSIVEQCEASLRRIQTEYIDLYWLHNWDRTVPVEETLRAMDNLVQAGKVRYFGISDVPAWKIAQAQIIAQFRGWAPVIAIQVEYSLLERTVEGELTPMAQEFSLGVMPWSPLKKGWLSGKYTRENAGGGISERTHMTGEPTEKDHLIIDAVRNIAEELNTTPAAVALAWVQDQPGVSSTVIGSRRLIQLRDNLKALEIKLSDVQLKLLNKISKPVLNFPADNNTYLAPSLAFAGATVDGVHTRLSPLLAKSMTRY